MLLSALAVLTHAPSLGDQGLAALRELKHITLHTVRFLLASIIIIITIIIVVRKE